MNKAAFSKYTEKIKAALPFWFDMKRKPTDSVGLSFLNVFGMQLDDVESILDYAMKQYFIDTADLNSVDIIYKVNISSNINLKKIKGVYSYNGSLKVVDTLYDFFGLKDRPDKLTHSIEQYNTCFVDYDNNTIFTMIPHGKSKEKPYGEIYLMFENSSEAFDLTIHHVWNFFDEFGALVGCQRLHGEKNFDYKQRILDVFKNPANSTKVGLANGIARELGIRENRVWKDDKNDFIIKDRMVIVDSITVNGDRAEKIYISPEGEIVLKRDEYKGEILDVSYIKGLSLEPLIDKHTNPVISNELYESDGSPTDLLKEYVKYIKDKGASILWGDFLYNEAAWVKSGEEFSGHFSFLPSRLDAKIGGFRKYGL